MLCFTLYRDGGARTATERMRCSTILRCFFRLRDSAEFFTPTSLHKRTLKSSFTSHCALAFTREKSRRCNWRHLKWQYKHFSVILKLHPAGILDLVWGATTVDYFAQFCGHEPNLLIYPSRGELDPQLRFNTFYIRLSENIYSRINICALFKSSVYLAYIFIKHYWIGLCIWLFIALCQR